MNQQKLDKINSIKKELDGLYGVLEGIDDVGPIHKIKFTGDEKTTTIALNEGLEVEMVGLFRDKIRVMIREGEEMFASIQVCEPSIIRSIKVNHFKAIEDKKWDCTYWFFDLHGTVLKPTYSNEAGITTEYYKHAKEVLQSVSLMDDVIMVMYTCSHPEELKKYEEFFAKDGINFHYINENPEVKNTGYGFYENKPYMNVLFEDKAGFNPEEDWHHVMEYLKIKNKWHKYQNKKDKSS